MLRAWQVFLFLNLIRDKVNFIVASPSNLSLVQDGFYILPQSREAAEGEGKVEVALHRLGVQRLSASQLLKIHDTLSRHHSKDPLFLHRLLAASQVTMTQKQPSWRCATCHVVMKGTFPRCWKCGQEWGNCYDPSFTPPDHRNQSYNQQSGRPPSWDGQQWDGHQSSSWSPRSRTRRSSNRGRKSNRGNNSWQDGDHQPHGKGRGKGQEQSFGQAPLPEHDASVSTAHDAASLTTTYDQQGCWKRSCTAASHDATEHIGSCSSNNALGTIGTNDADADSPNMLIYDARASHDLSSRWTSSTKAESTSQRDEEGRGQLTSTSPIHSPRDAETRREEQHQNALLSSASVGRCEARSARGRK